MKQRIKQSQFEELSEQAKIQYVTWATIKCQEVGDYTTAYRSIGHLIQFLDEHITHDRWHIERDGNKQDWRVEAKYLIFPESERHELCDALWEAVKGYLEAEYES